MTDLPSHPSTVTTAVTRADVAPSGVTFHPSAETLTLGGLGALVVGLGWRYLMRLVREDDERQRLMRAELAQLHREVAENRALVADLHVKYAVCEAQRHALEADVAAIKETIRRSGDE